MAEKQVIVTYKVTFPDGSDSAGAIAAFELSKQDYDSTNNEIVSPKILTAIADGTGLGFVSVWPNTLGSNGSTYTVTITSTTGAVLIFAGLRIPNIPQIDLSLVAKAQIKCKELRVDNATYITQADFLSETAVNPLFGIDKAIVIIGDPATLAPAAPGIGDFAWSAISGNPAAVEVILLAYPAAGTSPIDGADVSVDGGATWAALPGFALTTPYTVTVPSGVASQLKVRFTSASGDGAASPAQPATPWIGVAPAFTTAPTLTPASGAVGTVYTVTLGAASGDTTPTLTGVLTLDGTPVTVTGGTYTSTGAGALSWVVTASNGTTPDAVSTAVSATVTPVPVAPVFTTAPTITPATAVNGATYTMTEGAVSGYPAVTLTGVLTLDDGSTTTDVTPAGLTYVSDTPGTITWTVTADNGVGSPAVASVTAAVETGDTSALTFTAFGADKNIFDTGAAFGLNAAKVPVSVTGLADGNIVLRVIDEDGTEIAPFTNFGAATGAEQQVVFTGIPRPASGKFLQFQARLSTGSTTTMSQQFGAGHVVGFMGQSELYRTITGTGSGLGTTIVDPAKAQIVVGNIDYGGQIPGNPVLGYTVARDAMDGVAPEISPIMDHGLDVIYNSNSTDKFLFIDLSTSASGRFDMSDDSMPNRRWIDTMAALNAAGYADGVRPGLLVDMWTNKDEETCTEFVKAYKPFYTGLNADGSTYTLSTPITTLQWGNSGSLTRQHDHILFDLAGLDRGIFDPAETKISICHHRYDIEPSKNMANALKESTAVMSYTMMGQEILRKTLFELPSDPHFGQIMVPGVQPMDYENGTDASGNWGDSIHPGQGEDGLKLFARRLAYAALDGLGMLPVPQPEFDGATFDPAGAYVDITSSAGDITTTRKIRGDTDLGATYPHWTDVFGFEVDDVPVERAEIQGDGSLRVYVPPSKAPADWSQSRLFFGRGGGTGMIRGQEDPHNGSWLNYPVIAAAGLGIGGLEGLAIKPQTPTAILAPAAYRAAALSMSGTWFVDNQTMSAHGTSTAAFFRFRGSFGYRDVATHLFGDALGTAAKFSLTMNKALQLKATLWSAGGNKQITIMTMSPHVRYEITAAVDLTAQTCVVQVNGVTVLTHTIGSALGSFLAGSAFNLFGYPGQTAQDFELESFEIFKTADGSGAPHKQLLASSGAAALNAEAWKQGNDIA